MNGCTMDLRRRQFGSAEIQALEGLSQDGTRRIAGLRIVIKILDCMLTQRQDLHQLDQLVSRHPGVQAVAGKPSEHHVNHPGGVLHQLE